jgi:large subunit ribosomal protein L30
VTDKAQRTIHIQWVRSGIGSTYRQEEMVRSLGLRRLHQVVERPDTAQVRGLVARIPHMVKIVSAPPQPAPWAAIPEYTLTAPPQVAAPERAAAGAEAAEAGAMTKAPEAAAVQVESKAAKAAAAPAPAKAKKAAKPAKAPAAKGKAAREPAQAKHAPAKSAKPVKTKKK